MKSRRVHGMIGQLFFFLALSASPRSRSTPWPVSLAYRDAQVGFIIKLAQLRLAVCGSAPWRLRAASSGTMDAFGMMNCLERTSVASRWELGVCNDEWNIVRPSCIMTAPAKGLH